MVKTREEILAIVDKAEQDKEFYWKCIRADICPECGSKLVDHETEIKGFFGRMVKTGEQYDKCSSADCSFMRYKGSRYF